MEKGSLVAGIKVRLDLRKVGFGKILKIKDGVTDINVGCSWFGVVDRWSGGLK